MEKEYRVRSRWRQVSVRRLRLPIHQTELNQIEHLWDAFDSDLGQVTHYCALVGVFPYVDMLVVADQKVFYLLVVYLEVGHDNLEL